VTSVVLDASLALALVLPDEKSREIERLLEESERGSIDLLTASHWTIELANGLLQAGRRKRISAADRVTAFDLLTGLPVAIHPGELSAATLFTLADREGLSIYDTAYLALALEQKAMLATADKALAAAARRNDVFWRAR